MNNVIDFTNGSNTPLTMSSLEIAELVGKRHDKVKQSIERLANKGVIQLPPMGEVRNHLGQTIKVYLLEKRDSCVAVAQLSPEFTAQLVDRWQKLENGQIKIESDISPHLQATHHLFLHASEMEQRVAAVEQRVAAVETRQIPIENQGVPLTRPQIVEVVKDDTFTNRIWRRGIRLWTDVKAEIKSRGFTIQSFCDLHDFKSSSLYDAVTGRNNSPASRRTMRKLKRILKNQ